MDAYYELEMLGLIALAGILGGLIGWERKANNDSVGVRAHVFVSASAASLVFLAFGLVGKFGAVHPAGIMQSDPIRVIQAIIIGVSFLGSGAIAKDPKTGFAKNLSTAGSLLLATCVGIATAMGGYALAVGIAAFVIIVNAIFQAIDDRRKAEVEVEEA